MMFSTFLGEVAVVTADLFLLDSGVVVDVFFFPVVGVPDLFTMAFLALSLLSFHALSLCCVWNIE